MCPGPNAVRITSRVGIWKEGVAQLPEREHHMSPVNLILPAQTAGMKRGVEFKHL